MMLRLFVLLLATCALANAQTKPVRTAKPQPIRSKNGQLWYTTDGAILWSKKGACPEPGPDCALIRLASAKRIRKVMRGGTPASAAESEFDTGMAIANMSPAMTVEMDQKADVRVFCTAGSPDGPCANVVVLGSRPTVCPACLDKEDREACKKGRPIRRPAACQQTQTEFASFAEGECTVCRPPNECCMLYRLVGAVNRRFVFVGQLPDLRQLGGR